MIELRFERPLWANLVWLAFPLVPLATWLVQRRRAKRREAAAIPPAIARVIDDEPTS